MGINFSVVTTFINTVMSDKKKAPIVIGAGVLMALVVYFNILLIPQIKRDVALFTKVHSADAEYKRYQSDIAKIEDIKRDLMTYEEKVGQYEKMLPAEQEVQAILEELGAMAADANVKIVGITPVPLKAAGKKDQPYQETPISISAKSGYHELGKFIGSLENADRFMKVVDIDIKGNKAAPKRHEVELLVLTYVLLPAK